MEKREPSHTLGGNVTWYSHHGEQDGGSLESWNRATIWSSNPTPGHIFGENHNSKISRQCSSQHYLQWVGHGRNLKYPLTDEWVKKMWYINTMEYYLAIKLNETMLFAATYKIDNQQRPTYSTENGT